MIQYLVFPDKEYFISPLMIYTEAEALTQCLMDRISDFRGRKIFRTLAEVVRFLWNDPMHSLLGA